MSPVGQHPLHCRYPPVKWKRIWCSLPLRWPSWRGVQMAALQSWAEFIPWEDAIDRRQPGTQTRPSSDQNGSSKGEASRWGCLKGGGWKGGGTHLNRLLRHQKQLPRSERKTTPNRERLSSRSCLPPAHKLSKRNKIPSLVYLHINPSEMQSLPTPLLPYYLVINKTYPLHHQCIFPAAGHKRDS